ncbi:alpha/beta hydrolase [bacterium]|nr:alpha/beta hydrolase [bacterium]
MKVENTTFKPQIPIQKFTYNNSKHVKISAKNLHHDTFINNQTLLKTSDKINFQGNSIGTNLIINFLKNMCYNRSIKGSKRPYIPIENELKKITKEITIPVSKTESINALDINPNNYNQYIIFLHGFSHNITSNQPLYKALSEKKYGILAIDYRSYGKNKPSKHIKENDITNDILASIKYLKNKGIKNLGIIGHSFGGYMSAKISKLENFNFQILVAPLTSLDFWLRNVLKHPKKYNTESLLIKYIPGFKEQYKKIFNIKEHLAANKTPTYIVQAQHDRYIRTPEINELTKFIQNLKKYIIIPTGGHRMDDLKIEKISDIIEHL